MQLTSLLILLAVSVAMNEAPIDLFEAARKDAREKRYEEAMKKLQQLQKQDASEEVEIAIGNLFSVQKRWDEAIGYYRKALARNSWNSRARWNWEVALKQKSQQGPPPESPPAPQEMPQQLPQETNALLKYFDQLEKEQIRKNNEQKANIDEFDW